MESHFLHLSYEPKIIMVKHYKNVSCSKKLQIISHNFTDQWMTIQVLRERSFELGKKNRERYSIDIADPSSMQDTCYMNFLIDIAHCGVSMAQW